MAQSIVKKSKTANTIFQKATHWLVCKENFEFKWVNTPLLSNFFPVAGKTRKMSDFCNSLNAIGLHKSSPLSPLKHF